MRDAAYFESHYISNSNLKELEKMVNPQWEDPADLEEIFAFGHLVEDLIFQPHMADYGRHDVDLAMEMRNTFMKDPICQQLLFIHDLRRQHEWYRSDRFGVPARCKMDADSKMLSLVFELKGLSIDSDKAFEAAIDRFHYDMGLTWYLDVSGYRRALIVAVSKKSHGRLFKRLVDRQHTYYKRGLVKVNKAIKLYKETFAL